MRRLLAAIATAALVLAVTAVPSFSADGGTVNATVTPAAPCITLSFSALDFGTLPFNTGVSLSKTLTNPGSYTNCSAQSENVLLRGTNASGAGGAAWTLGSMNGCTAIDVFQTSLQIGNATWSVFTTNVEVDEPAAGATKTIDFAYLYMPCTGSSGVGTQMSWQYIFTATF